MNRRDLITLIGGAAAWPLAARAQQTEVPVIGYLDAGSPDSMTQVASFRTGLRETGFVEGRNVAIEYRWANNDSARLPALAADLVSRRVAVIATSVGTPAPLAAKAATTTLPIVFITGLDPVQTGLVASLNRPGGNLTGFTTDINSELISKWLGLLHELVPGARRIAVLENADLPGNESVLATLRAAASAIGGQIEDFSPNTIGDIDAAFASMVQRRTDAIIIRPRQLFFDQRAQIIELAARHALPAIYYSRQFTQSGGLMSYAADNLDQSRQAGLYAGRILKGEKPADLPVQQPTKFELVINLKTAKALGLSVPPTLIARSDEVIE